MGILYRGSKRLSCTERWCRVAWLTLFALGSFLKADPCCAYSVIMHEAIIDAEWDSRILPVLLKQFPTATPEELRIAKSYAYGGSVIQDLGYYPLGGQFFSHLTHYVRSGDFVEALFDESRNLNDYAFALGALSHYCADIQGHSQGINRAVPLLYPRPGRKYGPVMSWEESPRAHLLTEFSFDTLEVVVGNVAPQAYHRYIGFRVAAPLLKNAFRATYGLKLEDQTFSLGLSLFSYRNSAGWFVPEMTRVAWAYRGKSLEERATGLHHKSLFHLAHANIEASWDAKRTRPDLGDHVLAIAVHILPAIGFLNVFQFRTPTEHADQLFSESLQATVADYELQLSPAHIDPPNINLDTGRLTHPGEYLYGDTTFARWLDQLDRSHFSRLNAAMRESLVTFYSDPVHNGMREDGRKWRKIQRELRDLKAAPVQ